MPNFLENEVKEDAPIAEISSIAPQKTSNALVNAIVEPVPFSTDPIKPAAYGQFAFSVNQQGSVLPTSAFGDVSVIFGGTGADGALVISSGTTTINLASAQVVVKNYTSISITGTGALAFSNPHANGTLIILKSQGNVTVTSTTVPCIDASGMGAAGGTSASPGGKTGTSFATFNNGGITGGNGGSPAGGIGGARAAAIEYLQNISLKIVRVAAGAGGGEGGQSGDNNVNASGGRGGGICMIECAGALTFTGTVSCAGLAGTAGTSQNNKAGTGGGGGGSAGSFVFLYKTLTANTGTITKTGGAGGGGGNGQGGAPVNNNGGGGGGSGGGHQSASGAGGNGGAAGNNPGNAGGGGGGTNGGAGGLGGTTDTINAGGGGGGGGAEGISYVVKNTEFA